MVATSMRTIVGIFALSALSGLCFATCERQDRMVCLMTSASFPKQTPSCATMYKGPSGPRGRAGPRGPQGLRGATGRGVVDYGRVRTMINQAERRINNRVNSIQGKVTRLQTIVNNWTKQIPVKWNTVCEHKVMSLTCNHGMGLHIVQATYGRQNRNTCGHRAIRTTRCRSRISLTVLRKYCQGRRTCRVRASNGVFGDPCYGTFKYLQVRYKCVPQFG